MLNCEAQFSNYTIKGESINASEPLDQMIMWLTYLQMYCRDAYIQEIAT